MWALLPHTGKAQLHPSHALSHFTWDQQPCVPGGTNIEQGGDVNLGTVTS